MKNPFNPKEKNNQESKVNESKISERFKKAQPESLTGKATAETRINETVAPKKKTKLKAKLLVACSALMLAIISLTLLFSNSRKNEFHPTGEIARSMTYDTVDPGDENINATEYVKFDAFFLRDLNGDGIADGIRGACRKIGESETLYMELNILTQGKLENGVITINNNNFYLQTAIPKDTEVKENAIGNNINKIELNTINNGTQKLLTGMVRSGDYDYSSSKASAIENDTSKYSKENSVTLTGEYVSEDGETRIPIEKEVKFQVDWHGSINANIIDVNKKQDLTKAIDKENEELNLEFAVKTKEPKEELIIKKSVLEGEIPQLNGQSPIKVEAINNVSNFSYDEVTRKFTFEKESTLTEETGIVSNTISRENTYNIRVVYPLSAYEEIDADTVEIRIPVKAYYEGYNNNTGDFNNPEKSNTAKATIVVTYENPKGTVAKFDVYVGNYLYTPSRRYMVSKEKPLKIYNGISEQETDDNYIVKWVGYTGSDGESTGIIMKETKDEEAQVSDEFIKTGSKSETMEDVTSNVGIYFSNSEKMLGAEGEIRVYDDEKDELIETFTKNNWSKYNSSKPYTYERPIKHIRIETSKTNKESSIYVYNVKQLDDEAIFEKYEREQFDELQYIKSTLTGYVGENYINTDTDNANYEAPYSIANIKVSRNAFSTQVTEKNVKITISAEANENINQVKWTNGAFLLKLPKDIVEININSVTTNEGVQIVSYEQYEEDDIKYIKINTQAENPTTYDVVVDCDITPNPEATSKSASIDLYYYNENAIEYWYKAKDDYDINDNLNAEETIGKGNVSISLVSPSSILTSQTITNYDNKGSITVAPQIAEVSKEQRTADINIGITNNYTNTISEVKLIGRIPYDKNQYVINGAEMGSTFTAKMQSKITIPQELQGIAKVYYSENGEATNDIQAQENNWQPAEQVENLDNIRSYLIDLGEKTLNRGEKYKFTYTVEIPQNLAYNQVSYSHHAVYFSLDTTDGKYRTQTEPNKVGLMIARKFDLELEKYQKEKDILVPGATYLIKEDGKEEGKTKVTDANGKLEIENLYVDRKYIVKEIKSPANYELNQKEVTFKVTEAEGKLKIVDEETTKDAVREISVIEPQETQGYKVQIKVEDEVKPSLKIVKIEKQTEVSSEPNKVSGIHFKITGKNFTKGINLTTNKNGEVNLKGLSIGAEYLLEEVKAEGYYLSDPIRFKIINNEGNYEIKFIEIINNGEGSIQQELQETPEFVKEAQVTQDANIPVINLKLQNEKIPRYKLQIKKVKKGDETVKLGGAKFRLFKGKEKLGDYTTSDQGIIEIPNLYQYEQERNLDQTYTLKELLAPEGYAVVKDITFQVSKDAEGLLVMDVKEGIVAKQESNSEGNTITITIEDSPSFKLIKKDGEKLEQGQEVRLPNTKFAIYNVDDGSEQLALDSKFNILGTKEIINGKEYHVLTTNEQGEIEADLRQGLYKAVEIKACDDKYDITNNVYYFGIGTSREVKEGMEIAWATSVGGNNVDSISSVAGTSDGGFLVGGHIIGDIQVGEYTLNYTGSADGMIIKYVPDEENEGKYKVKWATSVGGDRDDEITSVTETSDGGFVVGGYFKSSIQVGGYTLNSEGNNEGMIIKYEPDEENEEKYKVEWATSVGGSSIDEIKSVASTSDGGVIVGGYFDSSSIQVGKYILNNNRTNYHDGMIIKYDANGQVEWARSIGGSSFDCIDSVTETSDGGFVVGGHFDSSSIQVGTYTLENKDQNDGMLIKYDANGQVEWATSVGGSYQDSINTVAKTSDGGFVVVGYFSGESIQVGTYTLEKKGASDGMIIKYNSEFEVEWATSVGGIDDEEINSIVETSDGGFVVGGYFKSNSIQVGEDILKNNKSSATDGMIIKYDANGQVEWATSVGGEDKDEITSVVETTDGGFVAGGYFESSEIKLSEEYTLNKVGTYSSDGMIIKYGKKELANPTTITARSIGESNDDKIESVVSTSDGGFVVGGYFESSSIQVGGYKLENKGSDDGMLIKYDANGQVEWATTVGGSSGDEITSVAETSDGGFIVGGYLGSSIQVGEYKLKNKGSADGMIIKYDANGQVEWATSVGGSSGDEITSVAETSDEGFIVGGYLGSSIQVGEYKLENKGSDDGMLIKCDANGQVKWATSVGGDGRDYINSVTETEDGGFVIGGGFESSSFQVGEYVLNNSGKSYNDGMILKYEPVESNEKYEVEWATSVGGSNSDEITSVAETSDGGFVVGGYFYNSIQIGEDILNSKGSDDGMIIKYEPDEENEGKYKVEWATSVGGSGYDRITSVTETSEGGFAVGGYFRSEIKVGVYKLENKIAEDGIIIKYEPDEKVGYEVQWAKSIGGDSLDYISSVAELKDGTIVAVGHYQSEKIETDGKTLNNNSNINYNYIATYYSDGMILKIANQVGVPEVEELEVKNYIKQFKITTDVHEIDGEKGGDISGEDLKPYEKVKYGNKSTRDIIMTPKDDYEIISVTVNGKEWPFEVNAENGSYTMDKFTDVKEDKHIVVTYSKKSNKIVIQKVDSKNQEPIAGVKFKLDQVEEERKNPNQQTVIGNLTNNSNDFTEIIDENEVTSEVKKEIINNGKIYVVPKLEKGEIEGVLQDIQQVGSYWFEKQTGEDGKEYYIPTNGQTYQLSHNGSADKKNTTANSYIPINLEGKTGDYVVVVNARVSSEKYDYGYATITKNINAPKYNEEAGRFMYISNIIENTDYTSEILEGGSTYYLHLGYYKDSSRDSNEDQVVINSIKVYETDRVQYGFEEQEDGKYIPTNGKTYRKQKAQEAGNEDVENIGGLPNTTANSCIKIDLSGKEGKYFVAVDSRISSQSSYDYGYVTINESESPAPEYNNSTGRFVRKSGTGENTIKSSILDGNKIYYLHLGYRKDGSIDEGEDQIVINSIKVYKTAEYNFYKDKNGTYKSSNQGVADTTANSYIPIDLQSLSGKYNLTIKAKVSSEKKGDYGYATVTKTTTAPTYSDASGRFVYLSGTDYDATIAKDYTTVLDGGYLYYLHLGYYKNDNIDDGEDTFEVSDIRVTLNEDDLNLYHAEITTNKDGKAIAEIPYGKYRITEVNTPKGYLPLEEPVIINFKETEKGVVIENSSALEDESQQAKEQVATYDAEIGEFTIVNKKASKITVHHYLKDVVDEDSNPVQVAEDEIVEGKLGDKYETKPHLDLQKYELEKDAEGNVIIPEDATGTFGESDGEVIYEYVEKTIPLTVHHYIDGTQTPVPLANGELAKDVTEKGKEGETYTTSPLEESSKGAEDEENSNKLNPKYELVQMPDNYEGEYEYTEVVVDYYYKVKNSAGVKVEHIDTNSREKIAKDVYLPADGTGKYGDEYTTNVADDLPQNYKFVNKSNNWKGTMVDELTTVIYEYELTDAKIIEENIEKEATQSILEPDEEVTYTINYKAKVQDYIGRVQSVVVDTLPYTINEDLSHLSGGTYDEENKTITWKQIYEDVDTYTNGDYPINFEKTITIVFKDIEKGKKVMTNNVRGNINLYTPEKASEGAQSQADTNLNFKTQVNVKKEWVDGDDRAQKRPTQIEIVLKNEEREIRKVTLTQEEHALEENSSIWEYTFADLDRYNEDGSLAQYTVEENAIGEDDLKFYKQEITTEEIISEAEKTIKITNTFNVPKEKISLNVTKKWIHTNNKYRKPEKVKIQVKKRAEESGEEVVVATKEIAVPDANVREDEEEWSCEFTQLDKYDSLGNEIKYFLGEEQVEGEDLSYYKTSIDDETKTITNTYDGPIIEVEKTAKTVENRQTETGEKYVLEGETITYSIKVTNSGEKAKVVKIKDTIPTGTSFVEESIKVNEQSNYQLTEESGEVNLTTYTDSNLESGIDIKVDSHSEVTLSFEVTVDNLEPEVFSSNITNKATVDEEQTEEVNTKVCKQNVKVSKINEPNSETKVKTGDTITYTIRLDNTKGTAPGNILVKDNMPKGTKFVTGSIKIRTVTSSVNSAINGEEGTTTYTEQNLKDGIKVTVGAGKVVELSFEVTVEDTKEGEKVLNNKDKIENIAYTTELNEKEEPKDPEDPEKTEKPTEKVENTYIEAIIDSEKTAKTQYETQTEAGEEYVIEGEIITYSIKITNSGDLAKEVTVKDNVPTGSSFVLNSIKVDGNAAYPLGEKQAKDYTQEELEEGIKINVEENSSHTLTFEVKVSKLEEGKYEGTIKNTANVDGKDTEETTTEVKKPKLEYTKESSPETGSKVEKDSEITYTIKVSNKEGTAKARVKVKDTIPAETTFVDESIQIDNESIYTLDNQVVDLKQKTKTNLEEGIELEVQAGEERILSFKVTVNDNENDELIENTAKVTNETDEDKPEKETNKVEHTYVEPIITGRKEVKLPDDKGYVLEGEKLIYKIIAENEGSKEKKITIKDKLPEGVTFITGSIKINDKNTYKPDANSDEISLESYDESNLAGGIEVTVPAKHAPIEGEEANIEGKDEVKGKVELSFEVTVKELEKELYEYNIENKAEVDGTQTDKVTTTVNKPNLKVTKTSDPKSEEEGAEGEGLVNVKQEDEITYTITLDNSEGTAPAKVIVKDSVPAGTRFVEESIQIDGQNSYKINNEAREDDVEGQNINLADKGEEYLKETGFTIVVPARGSRTLTFRVTVDDNVNDEKIKNKATIEEPEKPETKQETNETIHTYVEPEISQRKEVETANKKNYVVAGEKVTYRIIVENAGSLAKNVTIKDTIPKGLSLVADSINVNGNIKYTLATESEMGEQQQEIDLTNKTQQELSEEGIEVTVPAKHKAVEGESSNIDGTDEVKGKVELSFDVTVDKLGDSEYSRKIKNTATVDETTVESEEIIEKRTAYEYSKTSNPNTKEGELGEDLSGEITEVVANEQITYTITVDNTNGTIGGRVKVKDEIPQGTEFIANSIEISHSLKPEEEKATTHTAEELREGIEVEVGAGEKVILSFKVKVQDIEDLKLITNTAKVQDIDKPEEGEKEVGPVTHRYVEPVIGGRKESSTQLQESYVVEGEQITYKITVENTGHLGKTVKVKDKVPTGTSFVAESIKIDESSSYKPSNKEAGGEYPIDLREYDENNLEQGIEVYVEKGETHILSFVVSVDKLVEGSYEETIENTAEVDETPVEAEDIEVKKPNIVPSKINNPGTETKVKTGDKITYTIRLDNTNGTAPGNVKVKDEVPIGTEFVEESIRIKEFASISDAENKESETDQNGSEHTEAELAEGIEVEVGAGKVVELSFEVTVKGLEEDENNLENGAKIKNKAYIDKVRNPENPGDPEEEEKETEEVENTYIEPKINQKKEAIAEEGLEYVVEGEKITYKITVENSGDLEKEVIIKDDIPEEVTFVAGSMRINKGTSYQLGQEMIDISGYNESNLAGGINVIVPAKHAKAGDEEADIPETQEVKGKVELTFDATVNKITTEELTKVIENEATVDDVPTGKTTNTVKKPKLSYSKESSPATGAKVQKDEIIKYTITISNTEGTAPGRVLVKDDVPNGTSFVNGSIEIDGNSSYTLDDREIPLGEKGQADLQKGFEIEVAEGETRKLSFRVRVEDYENDTKIINKAKVKEINKLETEEKPNEETEVGPTEHTYIEPIISQSKTVETENNIQTETGEKYVLEGEKVTYKITVENAGSLEKEVTIKDEIPEGLTLENGSIRINELDTFEIEGQDKTLSELGREDLAQGIKVKVPAKHTAGQDETADIPDTNEVKGKIVLSFRVTVDELNNEDTPEDEKIYEKTIKNVATVDGNKTDEETAKVTVKKTNIAYTKTSEPASGTKVERGQEITYTIHVTNTKGTISGKVTIKDNVPEGTEFVPESIQVNESSSYMLDGVEQTLTDKDENDLAEGIEVNVPERGEVALSFRVKVKEELANGTNIENEARIKEDKEQSKEEKTNKTTHEVIAPIIEVEKTGIVDGVKDFVVKGDEITYSISVKNSGGIGTNVVIKDNIPEGTTFVDESIRVNGEEEHEVNRTPVDMKLKTADDLRDGIVVYVGPKTDDEVPGVTTLSFKVKVKEDIAVDVEEAGPEGTKKVDIKNKATAKEIGKAENEEDPEVPPTEEKQTEEVTYPVVTFEKQAQIVRKASVENTVEEETGKQKLGANEVTAEDEIVYTIKVTNVGSKEATNIKVKDTVPTGTTYKESTESPEIQENEITWTIDTLAVGESKTLSFTVTVNYSQTDIDIRNKAYVSEKETNETVTKYKKPEIKLETNIVKDGAETITSTDTKVYYEIRYTASINNFVGKAILTIVDKLPYEIDEENSEIPGDYVYNKERKTITWTEEINDIDTYKDTEKASISRTKSMQLKYIYPDEENLTGTIENTVTGTIELKQPNPEKQEKPEDPNTPDEITAKTEEKTDTHEVNVEIPGKVTVHHYFYDKETDSPTEIEIVPNEEKTGKVGDKYTTSKSNKVPQNYECKDENPEGKEGTMTKTPKEVTYYYTLKDETITNEMSKTAKASKTVQREENIIGENGQVVQNDDGTPQTKQVSVEVLTDEDGEVTYTIKYKVTIRDYIGKAKITIVDNLPAQINQEASSLAKGTYNPQDNTITWNETIENINTYKEGQVDENHPEYGQVTEGTYEVTIEKTIKLVYEGQNVITPLENAVTGSVTTYYPDILEPVKPELEKQTQEEQDKATVEQEYKVDKVVEKRWDDNNDKKGHRPDSVRVQLTANGQTSLNGIVGVQETVEGKEPIETKELESVELSEANNWTHTFTNLPKYDASGVLITYSVEETESNPGELEYYVQPPEIVITENKDDEENVNNPNQIGKIIVTNHYLLNNTQLDSNITKTGTAEINNENRRITYNINYHAVITDYIGEATLTITDTLPYEIDESNSSLQQGIYDEDTKTITWTVNLGHINTTKEENEQKIVDFQKEIEVEYKDLNVSANTVTNTVKGKIEFTENETKNEVEASYDTNVNITGKLVVKYVDKDTGKEIVETIEPGQPGNEDGTEQIEKKYSYETEEKVGTPYYKDQKEIYGYDFVEDSGNTQGEITEGTIEVTYYYARKDSGGVTAKYVDEDGNEIAPEEKIEGKVGDTYKTEDKNDELDNYEFAETTGDAPEGKLEEDAKEVVYHYRKLTAKVIVRYLEKGTNTVLLQEKVIEGKVGDSYETSREVIEGYRKAGEEPENANGKMIKDPKTNNTIYVTYYYERIPSGKITVKYLDKETGEEITRTIKPGEPGNEDGKEDLKTTYAEELQGYVGERYETREKEIPYYKYLEELAPTNKEGIYGEDNDTVIYYYQKLNFNFSVEKRITEASIDGKQAKVDDEGKIIKLEVVAKKVTTSKVEVKYEVVVTNTGEIEGTANIKETLPEGFKVSNNNPSYWEEQTDGTLTTEVKLKPGQSENLEVVAVWKNGNNNFGTMRNQVQIIDTTNPANYIDSSKDDNQSQADVVMSIKTGAEQKVLGVALGTIATSGLLVLLYQYQKYQKERNREIRHVVLEGKNVVIKKKRQK